MILSFSDRQVWTNSVEIRLLLSSPIRVYTVCHSVCIFLLYGKTTLFNFSDNFSNLWGIQYLEFYDTLIWAAAWQNQQNDMCAQRRLRSGLGIHPVWSESSLSAWKSIGTLATHWADSEDSDQTGRMPRLIWVFAGRTCPFIGFVMRRLIWNFTVTSIWFKHEWKHLEFKTMASFWEWKQIDLYLYIFFTHGYRYLSHWSASAR